MQHDIKFPSLNDGKRHMPEYKPVPLPFFFLVLNLLSVLSVLMFVKQDAGTTVDRA